MSYLLVTNNSLCYETYKDRYELCYLPDASYLEILRQARDFIHQGYLLITHPISGSLKPNQTPYRTVVLAKESMEDKVPCQDILQIESSIESCEKFLKQRDLPEWPEDIKHDFKTLDLSFVKGALEKVSF